MNRLPEFLKQAQRLVSGGMGSGSPVNRAVSTVAKVVLGVGVVSYAVSNSLWNVNGGHRGVVFSRVFGVKPQVYGEGTHLRLPWLERPFVFDIRTRPNTLRSLTGTRDLQMVDITLRVLYKPMEGQLPRILSTLGPDYDGRVLPSIVNETLKSVIAQFNASQLITQREQVSKRIRQYLTERASEFNILVDDVSITHLTFGREYSAAVENKQIAQQESERAKFLVEKAAQDKKSTIIRAEAEAQSALMLGKAIDKNPAYVELRRLEAARSIARVMSKSSNKMYLPSDSLLLNINQESGTAERFAAK